MSRVAKLVKELQQEANNTQRLLQSVPMEKATWKPHEKSMTLKELSIHTAEIFTWIHDVLNFPELDFVTYAKKERKIETTADLLSYLETNIKQGIQTLEKIQDSILDEPWTMRNGETIYFTLPKEEVIRTWVFSHLCHHRGQLTVYLRLLGTKVPGMFGPTADDNSM